MKQSTNARRLASPASCLFEAAWWGLLSGLIEVAIATGKSLNTPIINLGRDYVWMAPLALVALLLLPGFFFFLLSVLWKAVDFRKPTTFCCSLLAVFNLIILVPGIHHIAALLLAGGLATQIALYARKHRDAFAVLLGKTLPWMVALVVALGAGVQAKRIISERQSLAALPSAPSGAPNILFITLDTVRASSLSVYGYSRSTTPNLEALGRKSVVFDRALATASWTLPSHVGMFTGRAYHEISADWHTPYDGAYPTLAEFLSKQGYSTAGFVANMGYCSYETGLDRGFAHYEDYPISLGEIASSSTLVRTIADNFRLRRLIQNDEHLSRKSADKLNSDFLQWLGHEQTRPFFAFLNYFDAHDPYLPPAPFDRKFAQGRKQGKVSPLHRWLWDPSANHEDMEDSVIQEETAAYDGALAYLDDRLGVLFDALKQRGLWDNTLIVITADHGEEFGEHRVFSHGVSLYLSSVHVPLLISFPGRTPEGKRISTPVSLRDLPSTVVDLVKLGGTAPFPGLSLAGLWDNAPADNAPEEAVLSELNAVTGQPDWFPVSKGDMKALVFRGMRYIKNGDGAEELYDYDQDPWERLNLASSGAHRDSLEQLRSQLRRMLGE